MRRLGIEFVLDVAPADRQPAFVNAKARERGVIAYEDVAVLAAAG